MKNIIKPTIQCQDGCVTASARAFIPLLIAGDFNNDFLPKLQKYSLDNNNPENNHMLGVAVVCAQMGLKVMVHTSKPLIETTKLPENASYMAKLIHPQVVTDLSKLSSVRLTSGVLSKIEFLQLMKTMLRDEETYCLLIVDWDKWDSTTQSIFGNPRHIICAYECDGSNISMIDPAIGEDKNPLHKNVGDVFHALTDVQQLVFISKC